MCHLYNMLSRLSSMLFTTASKASSLRFLTKAQVQTYEEEGYLLVPSLLPPIVKDNLQK